MPGFGRQLPSGLVPTRAGRQLVSVSLRKVTLLYLNHAVSADVPVARRPTIGGNEEPTANARVDFNRVEIPGRYGCMSRQKEAMAVIFPDQGSSMSEIVRRFVLSKLRLDLLNVWQKGKKGLPCPAE
jgi:hypothetical protein